MTKADKLLEMLKRRGSVNYNEAARQLRIRNLPDAVYKLRKRGHRIETVEAVGKDGGRYAKGYRYYSGVAA